MRLALTLVGILLIALSSVGLFYLTYSRHPQFRYSIASAEVLSPEQASQLTGGVEYSLAFSGIVYNLSSVLPTNYSGLSYLYQLGEVEVNALYHNSTSYLFLVLAHLNSSSPFQKLESALVLFLNFTTNTSSGVQYAYGSYRGLGVAVGYENHTAAGVVINGTTQNSKYAVTLLLAVFGNLEKSGFSFPQISVNSPLVPGFSRVASGYSNLTLIRDLINHTGYGDDMHYNLSKLGLQRSVLTVYSNGSTVLTLLQLKASNASALDQGFQGLRSALNQWETSNGTLDNATYFVVQHNHIRALVAVKGGYGIAIIAKPPVSTQLLLQVLSSELTLL